MVKIISPQNVSLFQRDTEDNAHIPIKFKFSLFEKSELYEITTYYRKLRGNRVKSKSKPKYIKCAFQPTDKKQLEGEIVLSKGNYHLLFNFQHKNKKKKSFRKYIFSVGVGEVFITAGQSNAAFYGQNRQIVNSGMVRTMKKMGWNIGHDTNGTSFSTGNRGSTWPSMGENIYKKLGIPIGFVNVAKGGSAVKEWREETANYKNLCYALERLKPNGARCILWHQGESDSGNEEPKETYKEDLKDLILRSRKVFEFDIPWIIATAAYNPNARKEAIKWIIEAQKDVVNELTENDVYLGPTTEDIISEEWRFDGIHFSDKALKEVGHRWAKSILNIFFN